MEIQTDLNPLAKSVQLVRDFQARLQLPITSFIEMAKSKSNDELVSNKPGKSNIYIKTNLADAYPLPKEKVLLLLQKLASIFLPNKIDNVSVAWIFMLPEAPYPEEITIISISGDERTEPARLEQTQEIIKTSPFIPSVEIPSAVEEVVLPNESMQGSVVGRHNYLIESELLNYGNTKKGVFFAITASNFYQEDLTQLAYDAILCETFEDFKKSVPRYLIREGSGTIEGITYPQENYRLLTIDELVNLKKINPTAIVNGKFWTAKRGGVASRNFKVGSLILPDNLEEFYKQAKEWNYGNTEKEASFNITASGFEKEVLNQGLSKMDKLLISGIAGTATGILTFNIVRNLVRGLLGTKEK